MKTIDNSILELMSKLENNEISWDEYKKELKILINSQKEIKENQKDNIKIAKEIDSEVVIFDNTGENELQNNNNNNNFRARLSNPFLHDEETMEKEEEKSDDIFPNINEEKKEYLGIVPQDKEPIITIKKFSMKIKNKKILNDITFNIYPGEFHILIGENKTGKTSIIKSIIGAFPKHSFKGEIKIFNIKNLEIGIEKRIGFVPENTVFPKKMILKDYLYIMTKIVEPTNKNIEEKVFNIIDQYNLYDIQNSKIYNLSSGEKRKILIIQALMCDPEILILDQPETNLDYQERIQLFEMLTRLKNKGKTVFLSTHNLDEVNKYATFCTIFHDKEIVFDGIFNSERISLVELYRKSINKWNNTIEILKSESKKGKKENVIFLDNN